MAGTKPAPRGVRLLPLILAAAVVIIAGWLLGRLWLGIAVTVAVVAATWLGIWLYGRRRRSASRQVR